MIVNLSFVPVLFKLITPCFCVTVMRYINEGQCAQFPVWQYIAKITTSHLTGFDHCFQLGPSQYPRILPVSFNLRPNPGYHADPVFQNEAGALDT